MYCAQRKFSHTRFIFLLIVVLNTLETKDHITNSEVVYRNHFTRDLAYCRQCFESQIPRCSILFEQIQVSIKFSLRQIFAFLNNSLCKRNNVLIELKNSKEKLITKYVFNRERISGNILELHQLKRDVLRQQEKDLQGMQYAPLKTIHNFIKTLQNFHKNLTETAIYIYLLNNIQPLILPLLYERSFPVPKTYAVCGFTFYQQFAGEHLYSFFTTDFLTKLDIAKQLLQAAIKFSHGFDNYRLYITDLTADNIVYDKAVKELYFVDLDTIFIVDATAAKYKSFTHKHTYIECPGCFAYVADDIASYNISDINIYSACQFLREDLYKEQSKGFLYPLPSKYDSSNSKLWQLLNTCVDCPDDLCSERFTVAKELIKFIKQIM